MRVVTLLVERVVAGELIPARVAKIIVGTISIGCVLHAKNMEPLALPSSRSISFAVFYSRQE